MSTTSILRWVYQQTNGDLRKAMSILYCASNPDAKNAYRVLRDKQRNHPGCSHFSFTSSGFIELDKAA